MITLAYHLKDPGDRKSVDLRDYVDDLTYGVNSVAGALLIVVGKDFYVIRLNPDIIPGTNKTVRKIGRRIAKTSLKYYVKRRGKSKKGVDKNELFIRMKKVSKKQKNSEYIEIIYEPGYDPFYDPSR